MKVSTLAIIAVFTMLTAPAMAQLTDYQKGFSDGLGLGLAMGKLQGLAQYSTDAAVQLSNSIESFNQQLVQAFGNNETMISKFKIQPTPQATPYQVSGETKPVHSIDGSWNQTSSGVPLPDASGRIGEYPADAYYTATGNWPSSSQYNAGGLPAP